MKHKCEMGIYPLTLSLMLSPRILCPFDNFNAIRVPNARKTAIKILSGGFPCGAVVENLPASAGDTGSSPGLGRSHMLRSN